MQKKIKIKPSHVGLFTKEASSAGMSVRQYADHVLAPNSHAGAAVKKRANFAKNFGGKKK
jgi:hypothetical protein